MEMCRACLSTETGIIKMDKTFVYNYNILTSLNLKFTKHKPLYTCKTCFDGANFCTEFRNKCIASDLSLKELSNQHKQHFPDVDECNENNVMKEETIEFNEPTIEPPDYCSDERNQEEADILAELKTETIDDLTATFSIIKDDDDSCFLPETKSNDDFSNYYSDKIKEDDGDIQAELKTKTTKTLKKKIQMQKSNNKKLVVGPKVHCKICPENFEDKNALAKHLKNHKLNVPCCLCGEHFMNLPHLLGHRIVHMPKDEMRCHICPKKFLTAIGLEYHYMRIHELAEKDTPIQCKKCLSSFDTGKKLSKHYGDYHTGIKYTCDICTISCKRKSELKYHMIKHGQLKPYKCDLCDYSTKYCGGLKSHKLRKHTEGRVYCKTCPQVFISKSLLDEHICKNAMGAICSVCGLNIKIRKSTSLKDHMQSHDEFCKYKCEKCPAKYKTVSNFKTHMDKHAGTPRNRCVYCLRSFYSRSVLTKHLRTHTGEKPYVCLICNKGFTGNHNLKVHMKVHGIMNLIVKKDKA